MLIDIIKTKFCPQRGENCNPDDCAHWKNIKKVSIPYGYGGDYIEVNDGICRLWVDKKDEEEL